MANRPMPRFDATNLPFWESCNAERLLIQRCAATACRRYIYYPRVCCPHCRSSELDWLEASGTGEVVTHTTIYRPHHESFYAEAPYIFAAVRLQEGPIVYARLANGPYEGSLVGRTVKAVFDQHTGTQKILSFEILETGLRDVDSGVHRQSSQSLSRE